MKQRLFRMVSLLLALCLLIPGALAEAAQEENAVMAEPGESIRAMFEHGGVLYTISYYNDFFRQVEGGWQALGKCLPGKDEIIAASAGGEEVWLIVSNPEVDEDDDDEIRFRMVRCGFDADGVPVASGEPVDVRWDQSNVRYVQCLAVMDGMGYVMTMAKGDWDNSVVYQIDLTSGEGKKIVKGPLTELRAYKDGLLLAGRFTWDDMDDNGDYLPPQVVTVDTATGEIARLGMMVDLNDGAIVYDPVTDAVYFSDGGFVYKVAGDTPERVGYLISNDSTSNSCAFVMDGIYSVGTYHGVASAPVNPELLPKKTLRVSESWMIDDVIHDFAVLHPDISIEFCNVSISDLDAFVRTMKAGNAPDLFAEWVDPGFVTMRDKGYLADLSSSQVLMDTVGRMLPNVTSDLLKDGKLYGLPVELQAYMTGYYPNALEKAGIPAEAIPTTYGELLDFMVTWHDDYYDDNMGMEVWEYATDLRWALIYDMFEAQLLSCQRTGELTFDTPTMRALMARLDEIQPILDVIAPQVDEESYEYMDDNAIFTADHEPLPRAYPQRSWTSNTVVMSLDEQTDPVIPASVAVLTLNPYTKNADAAMELLEYVAQNLPYRLQISIMPDPTKPVENLEYEREIKWQQDRIADLEKAIENAAEEERVDLNDELADRKENLARYESESRWGMTVEEMRAYCENIAPYLTLRTAKFFTSNGYDQMFSTLRRYAEGQLSADNFIKEMDRIAWMMREE